MLYIGFLRNGGFQRFLFGFLWGLAPSYIYWGTCRVLYGLQRSLRVLRLDIYHQYVEPLDIDDNNLFLLEPYGSTLTRWNHSAPRKRDMALGCVIFVFSARVLFFVLSYGGTQVWYFARRDLWAISLILSLEKTKFSHHTNNIYLCVPERVTRVPS